METSQPSGWVRFDWPLTGRSFTVDTPPGYHLRPAQPQDREAMLRVVARAYASDPVWSGMTDDINRRVGGRIRASLGHPHVHFVVCECAGQLVGLNGVALTYDTGQNLITGICVEPAHQGRGVGTALLGRTLEWLRDEGLSHATVTTDGQSNAARIYARFGSVRTDNVHPGDAPKRS